MTKDISRDRGFPERIPGLPLSRGPIRFSKLLSHSIKQASWLAEVTVGYANTSVFVKDSVLNELDRWKLLTMLPRMQQLAVEESMAPSPHVAETFGFRVALLELRAVCPKTREARSILFTVRKNKKGSTIDFCVVVPVEPDDTGGPGATGSGGCPPPPAPAISSCSHGGSRQALVRYATGHNVLVHRRRSLSSEGHFPEAAPPARASWSSGWTPYRESLQAKDHTGCPPILEGLLHQFITFRRVRAIARELLRAVRAEVGRGALGGAALRQMLVDDLPTVGECLWMPLSVRLSMQALEAKGVARMIYCWPHAQSISGLSFDISEFLADDILVGPDTRLSVVLLENNRVRVSGSEICFSFNRNDIFTIWKSALEEQAMTHNHGLRRVDFYDDLKGCEVSTHLSDIAKLVAWRYLMNDGAEAWRNNVDRTHDRLPYIRPGFGGAHGEDYLGDA